MSSMKMSRASQIFAISISLFTSAITTESYAQQQGKVRVHGKTFGAWSGEWWQWIRSFNLPQTPADPQHPFDEGDPNVFVPVDCSREQSGPVWFLPGNQGGVSKRSCSVPKNKSLFFPLVNAMFFNFHSTNSCTIDTDCGPQNVCENGLCVEAFDVESKRVILHDFLNQGCNLVAELDGRPLIFDDIAIVRTQSPPFTTTAAEFDYLGEAAGSEDVEAISDGYWMMLPQLSVGTHTLHFGGATCANGVPFFSVDVTYQLTVTRH